MKSTNNSGFTLIELLIVIAIIGILASLMLSALSKAKLRAQQVSCLNGLRQWSIAALMYKEDNDDFLPREKCVDTDHTWADLADPINHDVWFNALPKTSMGIRPASSFVSDSDLFHSSRIFQCPTARFQGVPAEPRFSLAMNSQLSKGTNLLQATRFASIGYPAQTVLFLECGVTGETPQVCSTQGSYNSRPYTWAVRLSARHNLGSNLTFGDGHAQWFRGLAIVDPATGKGYVPAVEVRWTP